MFSIDKATVVRVSNGRTTLPWLEMVNRVRFCFKPFLKKSSITFIARGVRLRFGNDIAHKSISC